MLNKIKKLDEIIKISHKLREEGKTIVTTNGCFDILHVAHINLINYAKNLGDTLIVLLNSDTSIRSIKGDKRPIVNENDRALMLAALEAVDYVVIFNEQKPISLLGKIKPSKHVKGSTSDISKLNEEKNFLEPLGTKYIIVPEEKGKSTTNIIEEIIFKYAQGHN